MKKISRLIVFLIIFCNASLAEERFSFNENQKLRVATTFLISQVFSRGLSELGIGKTARIVITDVFLIGTALTAEALSPNFSKNNLAAVGMGLAASNVISITLDW